MNIVRIIITILKYLGAVIALTLLLWIASIN